MGRLQNGKTRASVNAFSSSSSRRCVPLRGAFTRSCRATCRWKTWCMRAYWVDGCATEVRCQQHVQFSSYAKFRIRGAILDSLRELDWSPRDLRRKARMLEETSLQLSARLGRTPGEAEMAKELGLELSAFQHLLVRSKVWRLAASALNRRATGARRTCASTCPTIPRTRPTTAAWRGSQAAAGAGDWRASGKKNGRCWRLYYFEELTMKEVGRHWAWRIARIADSFAGHRAAAARLSEMQGAKSSAASGASAAAAAGGGRST